MRPAQEPQDLPNPAPFESQKWGYSIYLGVGVRRGASIFNGAHGTASSPGGEHA